MSGTLQLFYAITIHEVTRLATFSRQPLCGSRCFYDNILAQGVDFDVIGLPYYPFWHGPLSALQANLNDLAPVPNRRGRGVIYWESAWIPGVGWEPGAGDAWDTMTLFDFNGAALPSIKIFEGARDLLQR